MTNIRRYWQPGRLCFLTHVTLDRAPILVTHSDLLLNAIHMHRSLTPFDVIAWVILPDHLHLLVDPNDNDVSRLIRRIKLSFSTRLRGRLDLKDGRVWQYRFWDRMMRNQDDVNRHIEYIHYNPVKHGYVSDPFMWPQSSLAEHYAKGLYQRDWGILAPVEIEGEFGE